VGGGIVGVEVAAELADKAKERGQRIGLVSRPETVLPETPKKARRIALEHLKRKGVELYLGQYFTDDFQKRNNFEHIIRCTGFKVPTSFMKEHYPKSIDPVTGQIFVNNNMQMVDCSPFSGCTKIVYSNIYACGDCCLTKCDEAKAIVPLKICARVVSKNLL
jgi:NADH dehydrogenase FAD-containing subunit